MGLSLGDCWRGRFLALIVHRSAASSVAAACPLHLLVLDSSTIPLPLSSCSSSPAHLFSTLFCFTGYIYSYNYSYRALRTGVYSIPDYLHPIHSETFQTSAETQLSQCRGEHDNSPILYEPGSVNLEIAAGTEAELKPEQLRRIESA